MYFHVILHFQQLDPGNFGPFKSQGFTCASHLDTILVSIVSIGRLSTAWCKLDCHTPVSRWGFWGDVARVGWWSCLSRLCHQNHSKGEGPLMYDPVWSFEASCIKLSCLGFFAVFRWDIEDGQVAKNRFLNDHVTMWFHRVKQTLNYERWYKM